MRKIVFFSSLQLCVFIAFAQTAPDASVIDKIKKEGVENSKVMDIAFQLTDVSGPRLTASPNFMKAANWAKNTLTSWGLVNAQLEPWGEFGKGWQQERCYVAMTKPYYAPFIAIPRAWTGSTPGNKMINSGIVLIKAKDSAELLQYAGKLKNKVVMLWVNDALKPSFEADAERFADSTLAKMASARPNQNGAQGGQRQMSDEMRQQFMARQAFQRNLTNLYNTEKPALVLSINARGTDGTVFVQGGGDYKKEAAEGPANVMLSSDDYLRLQRLANAGIPVELEADVKTKFFTSDLKGYNVIAEIPGTDPKLKDEVVMLGGHLDSWQGATGATDNAAGCAVMMEAVRILKSMNIQPRRTIRIALWSGEEQGLFGSRNYVKNHLGDPATMELKPEHAKVSAYYNLDNGTGRIRGVYLQGNEGVRSLFTNWLKPFNDMGASTITFNNTGGTDHLAFDAVGIPGFQFIQDPVEYDTRTHHTNMDTYDHLVPEDLKQASMIVAAFVYHTAMQDEKLPRKELPKARGEGRAF
ncbi:MAG TPA: M20/M25/M40 family metallo-hydrolase [Flavisolibacter sp.]|nr:M20/M25/M40 family metallo-hydrolase [Flavisolibacter sp.]